MRYRWLVLILLIGFLVITPAAQADIITVSHFDPVDTGLTLPADDVEKLRLLQATATPALLGNISPDDQTIFTGVLSNGEISLGFMNINDGTVTPVNNFLDTILPLSNLAWRDNDTAVFVALDEFFEPVMIAMNRNTGEVTTTPQELAAFPVSLSPNGSRLLLAEEVGSEEDETDEEDEFRQQSWLHSPFNRVVKLFPDPVDQYGDRLAAFDTNRHEFALSTEQINLSYLDLNTQEVTHLTTIPESSGLASAPAWTPDGSRLALVRTTIPEVERGGTYLSELIVQDTLGNLSPLDNPFFQGNVVDIFNLTSGDLRPAALKAAEGSGETFLRVAWSPDGQTLLAQMQRPSVLAGRSNPIYLYPDRTSFRFYNTELQQIGFFDANEVAAPNLVLPRFVSPDEVIFNAPYGLSHRLYSYNIVSQAFNQLSIWEGTYFDFRATRLSRQLIYTFSSYQHPPEIYRIGWDGSALAALTYHNVELETVNQIRVDPLTFTLNDGATRSGYLLQPAGAAFPPQNIPVVVWQDGGPGGATTSRWGVSVENPFNLLPNFDIPLLIIPLSGREGHGPEFYNALAQERNFGSVDIDEGAQIVQQMVARGYTSADRVGITGCSYGGYYTSQSITRYPDLYAAANTQCSLLDLFHEWQFGSTWYISYLMGRAPTADAAEYVADSPAYNATLVQTPLLIFHGTDDFLPVTIAANYHDQIEANGTPVQMLMFENEGHGLEDPENQLIAAQSQVAWFWQHLAGLSMPETGDEAPETSEQPEPQPTAEPEPGEAAPKPGFDATEHDLAGHSSPIIQQTIPQVVETELAPAMQHQNVQPAASPAPVGTSRDHPASDHARTETRTDITTDIGEAGSHIRQIITSRIELFQQQSLQQP